MNKLNIAVVGSGLSALGALSAIRDNISNCNVTIYSHTLIPHLKTRHKIIFHTEKSRVKYGLHLVKTITNSQNNDIIADPLIRAISYNCLGGSSSVWGGACHPLLEYEASYFDVNIAKGYEVVSNLFDCDGQFIKHVSTPVSVKSEIAFTKTLTLGNHHNPNNYNVKSVTSTLINKMGRLICSEVIDIKDNGKKVLLQSKVENGNTSIEHYDFVILASGVVGTTRLMASYFDKIITLTHSTNEQYLFLAKYNTKFNQCIFGPPSLLINNVMGFPAYVQLYPINMFAIVNSENLFSTSKDAASKGLMAGYLYIDSRASSRLQTQSFQGGPCEASILDSVHKSFFDVNRFIEKMKIMNMNIIGKPIKLFPTSSQHIGASVNNSYNSLHYSNSKILITDTTAMRHVPLCTIGLTSAANAYTTTRNFFQ